MAAMAVSITRARSSSVQPEKQVMNWDANLSEVGANYSIKGSVRIIFNRSGPFDYWAVDGRLWFHFAESWNLLKGAITDIELVYPGQGTIMHFVNVVFFVFFKTCNIYF